MQTDMVGYGGMYETFRLNLRDDQIREAFFRIMDSKRFELGEQSHIVLRGTDTIVGYIGNSSLELCCSEGRDPEIYRTPHKHLRRIFRSV